MRFNKLFKKNDENMGVPHLGAHPDTISASQTPCFSFLDMMSAAASKLRRPSECGAHHLLVDPIPARYRDVRKSHRPSQESTVQPFRVLTEPCTLQNLQALRCNELRNEFPRGSPRGRPRSVVSPDHVRTFRSGGQPCSSDFGSCPHSSQYRADPIFATC